MSKHANFQPFLSSLTFEVRYAHGFSYLDRCGQTLLDLERHGWVPGEAHPQSGTAQMPDKRLTLTFNCERLVVAAHRPQNDLSALAHEIHHAWGIVRGNLGLEELIRVGCRFDYFLAVPSVAEGEARLNRSRFNVTIPDELTTRYSIVNRQLNATVSSADLEFRILLQVVMRTEGVPVSSLPTTSPRILAKKQREARIEMIKQRHAYSTNPEFGINLDVDCALYEPAGVSPLKYVLRCHATVTADFLPLLAELSAG